MRRGRLPRLSFFAFHPQYIVFYAKLTTILKNFAKKYCKFGSTVIKYVCQISNFIIDKVSLIVLSCFCITVFRSFVVCFFRD